MDYALFTGFDAGNVVSTCPKFSSLYFIIGKQEKPLPYWVFISDLNPFKKVLLKYDKPWLGTATPESECQRYASKYRYTVKEVKEVDWHMGLGQSEHEVECLVLYRMPHF